MNLRARRSASEPARRDCQAVSENRCRESGLSFPSLFNAIETF